MEDTNQEELEEEKTKDNGGKHAETKKNSSRMLAVGIVAVLVVVGIVIIVNSLISTLVFG